MSNGIVKSTNVIYPGLVQPEYIAINMLSTKFTVENVNFEHHLFQLFWDENVQKHNSLQNLGFHPNLCLKRIIQVIRFPLI